MATSIGQYTPVFLPGEPPLWQRSLAGHSLQGHKELDHDQSDPACMVTRLFLPVAALPQWELSVKVAQLLGLWGPWQCQVCRDTDCLHRRSYGPIRVFFWASCSWQSEGLFGQSFSVALPIQALRGLPCLGSFSVVLLVRHIEGLRWLESYSVDRCIRYLKGHLGAVLLCSSVRQAFDGPASLLFSCQCWRVGERDSAVSPCFHGCPAFLHRHFPP